jgi:hypothetical protein
MANDRNFQKAAVALLLSAPSGLNRAWLARNDAAVQAEMTRLGFAPEFTAQMTTAFGNFRADEAVFSRVSELLKFGVWAGGEPHPNPDGARAIVDAMKALDGE